MPRNPSGTNYTAPNTFSPGTKAYSAQVNANFQDVGNELVNSLPRDGRAPMTGTLNMNGQRITNLPEPVDPGDAVPFSEIADLGVAIGDFRDSVRDMSPNWLRRDGAIYSRSAYPELSDMLPPLPDGVVWDQKPIASNPSLLSVLKIDSGYVVSGGSGYLAVSSGEDGWIAKDVGVTSSLSFISEGSGIYFTGGATGVFRKSSDLNTWSAITLSGINFTNNCYYDGTNFIALCANAGAPVVYTSPDSNTWTVRTIPGSASYASAASNNSRLVAVGGGGQIATSDNNGSSWTARTSGVSQNLRRVIWDEWREIFIAVGTNGTIITSADGLSWATRSSSTTQTLNDVVADSEAIIVVGNSGVVRLSTNGTTFTSPVSSLGDTIQGASVAHDPKDIVVVGSGGLVAFGSRTSPTQFRVPNDNPEYGWIRAV